MPAVELFRGWCDAPCLLRLKPGAGQRLTDGSDPARIALHGEGCAACLLAGHGRDRFPVKAKFGRLRHIQRGSVNSGVLSYEGCHLYNGVASVCVVMSVGGGHINIFHGWSSLFSGLVTSPRVGCTVDNINGELIHFMPCPPLAAAASGCRRLAGVHAGAWRWHVLSSP